MKANTIVALILLMVGFILILGEQLYFAVIAWSMSMISAFDPQNPNDNGLSDPP